MGGNEERNSLASIYREPYDFALSVHEDIPQIFFNMDEFGAIHDIDGQKVPCVVTGRKNEAASMDGITRYDRILFVMNKHVNRAESGMTVKLDGRIYTIGSAHLIQGELWRIELGVYDG